MALFGNKRNAQAQAQQQQAQTTPKRSSMFSRRNNANNLNDPNATNNNMNTSPNSSRSGSGMFSRNNRGGSISTARNKMSVAERAEQDALKSLNAARNATQEARNEVTRLEHEADEE